jgi:hypothetical protein
MVVARAEWTVRDDAGTACTAIALVRDAKKITNPRDKAWATRTSSPGDPLSSMH